MVLRLGLLAFAGSHFRFRLMDHAYPPVTPPATPPATPLSGQLSLQADREVMLAFLRNDLAPEAELKLRARLADEPTLREELSWLREAMEAADADEMATLSTGADALPFAGNLLAPADADGIYTISDESAPLDASRFLPTPFAMNSVESGQDAAQSTGFGSWLDRQSWVVLPVLLVLLLAQAGAIAWLTAQRNQLASALHANTMASVRAQLPPCLSVWVAPLDTTPIASLRDWMTLYGGRFIEGPDNEGHIRIAFHDEMDLAAAMHDPATIKIARRIDEPAGCNGP